MERFGLHRDPDGRYLLYLSYEHPEDGRWRIDVIEETEPGRVRPGAAADRAHAGGDRHGGGQGPVRAPSTGPAYLMLVSTFLTDAGPAPTYLATSLDGLGFRWDGELLGVGERLGPLPGAAVVGRSPASGGFVGFYDGAAGPEEDTEERLGRRPLGRPAPLGAALGRRAVARLAARDRLAALPRRAPARAASGGSTTRSRAPTARTSCG